MIDFTKKLKKPEKSESNELPILEIKLNVAHLKTQLGISNNEDLFFKLSQRDNSPLSYVCKSLYDMLNDNRSSVENDILQLLKEIRNANDIIYQEWPCGSCGKSEHIHWKRVCMNGHCWCPTCVM